MLLVIDVGNTNMVFGIYEKGIMRECFRISTGTERTSDELGIQILQYYTVKNLCPQDTDAVLIASVVPTVMYSLTNAVRKYLGKNPHIVGEDVDAGVVNRYDNPAEVGADRLVNAAAALQKYGTNLIIVDIGTATTFDAVDQSGAYLGGAIFPGIKVAMDALFLKTAKLPRVEIYRPENAIGRTTVESIQSGTIRGYIGALSGIISDMKAEMQGQVKVIATGGMGRMMAEYCPLIDSFDANLTLDGLYHIYKQNAKVFADKTEERSNV